MGAQVPVCIRLKPPQGQRSPKFAREGPGCCGPISGFEKFEWESRTLLHSSIPIRRHESAEKRPLLGRYALAAATGRVFHASFLLKERESFLPVADV